VGDGKTLNDSAEWPLGEAILEHQAAHPSDGLNPACMQAEKIDDSLHAVLTWARDMGASKEDVESWLDQGYIVMKDHERKLWRGEPTEERLSVIHIYRDVTGCAMELWALEHGYVFNFGRWSITVPERCTIKWSFNDYVPAESVTGDESYDTLDETTGDHWLRKVTTVRRIPTEVEISRIDRESFHSEHTKLYQPNSQFAAALVLEGRDEADTMAILNSLLAYVDPHIQKARDHAKKHLAATGENWRNY
jgi:hypothetical protein